MRLFPHPAPAASPGLYHYRRQAEGEQSRIHLRLDPDGSGTLIVNASRVLHLNPSAAQLAFHLLEGHDESVCVDALRREYEVDRNRARQDVREFRLQLEELLRPDGACPIHELDLETRAPFSDRPSAPYRMDLALTYRCNNDCAHCYNGRARSFPELDTDHWKRLLDRLWELGIPHVVFTGGEPTLREDLPALIAHAEANGQITGLNTNGRRLSDPRYVERLVAAGLDHVQVTLESHDPAIHDRMVRAPGAFPQTVRGVRNALATRLYVMTNTTMLRDNAPSLAQTLDFLAELGVPTVGLNALIHAGHGATVDTGLDERALRPLLELARAKTEAHHQRLIWYTPTEYCHFDPVQLDLGVKGCTAALYNMCVEPNGDVLPCQSYYRALGNLLHDPWQAIWEHPLSVRLRERQGLPEKCSGCALVRECGGGCPLQFEFALQEGAAGNFVPVIKEAR